MRIRDYLIEGIDNKIANYLEKKWGEDVGVTVVWLDKKGKWNTMEYEQGGWDGMVTGGKDLDAVMGGWKEDELKGQEEPKLARIIGAKKAWIIDM